jgi:hypothetical protein
MLDSKPQTLNPKLKALKPQTLNPEPLDVYALARGFEHM